MSVLSADSRNTTKMDYKPVSNNEDLQKSNFLRIQKQQNSVNGTSSGTQLINTMQMSELMRK
jgi:hypothetical protein